MILTFAPNPGIMAHMGMILCGWFIVIADLVAPEADSNQYEHCTPSRGYSEAAARTPDLLCAKAPLDKLAQLPEAWAFTDTERGKRIKLTLLFLMNDCGRQEKRELVLDIVADDPGVECTYSDYPHQLGGLHNVQLADGVAPLADSIKDNAWLSSLKSVPMFIGGARPEHYSPAHAKAVQVLCHAKVSPMRLVMRMAAVLVAQSLIELGFEGRRRIGWGHHLRASNLNSPGNHGDVLLKAAVDSKDVIYIPAQVGDGKTAVAAMGLAVSREFPFSHEMLVATTCWPALNRPHIAYNRNLDVDQDVEDLQLPSAVLWDVTLKEAFQATREVMEKRGECCSKVIKSLLSPNLFFFGDERVSGHPNWAGTRLLARISRIERLKIGQALTPEAWLRILRTFEGLPEAAAREFKRVRKQSEIVARVGYKVLCACVLRTRRAVGRGAAGPVRNEHHSGNEPGSASGVCLEEWLGSEESPSSIDRFSAGLSGSLRRGVRPAA
ncbi:hypothetical protein ACOME3_010425 [Neoechinorhynchus agilis]